MSADMTAAQIEEARWAARTSGYDDAILAGARALYIASGEGTEDEEWADADPYMRIGWSDDAAIVLAAARPVIEREVRGQIAAELGEAAALMRKNNVAEEWSPSTYAVALADAAARVARGGASDGN